LDSLVELGNPYFEHEGSDYKVDTTFSFQETPITIVLAKYKWPKIKTEAAGKKVLNRLIKCWKKVPIVSQ
jgi:hypothetical protein